MRAPARATSRPAPSMCRRQPPRDQSRNLTKRSRMGGVARRMRVAAGSRRVSKWKTEPSVCSRASRTGHRLPDWRDQRVERAHGQHRRAKAGSSAGVMLGATSGIEACRSIRMTNPAEARSEGAPTTEPTRRPGLHRPAAHDIIGPTTRGTVESSVSTQGYCRQACDLRGGDCARTLGNCTATLHRKLKSERR